MRFRFVVVVIILSSSLTGAAFAAPAPAPGPAPASPAPGGPARAPEPAPSPASPAAPLAPAQAGTELPTMEQLNAQLAEGKHQEVLRQVAKLLGLRGEHAKTYDRYDLLCLRGEAALRGKANSMAMEAFAQAAKAADDPDKQAVARATELLIRRSKPLGYVPRATQAAPAARAGGVGGAGGAGGAGKVDAAAVKKANEPISYIEPDDRKRAFAALFADEMAVAAPKVKTATSANGLPPIIDAIKSIGDLRALEVAATGSSTQTKAISGDLGSHAHQLIAGTLTPMERRVEECWTSGSRSTVTEIGGNQYKQPGMWGLTSAEQNDLKNIIVTCEKVQPVANELATVTERAELIADAQMAQKLHARATEVLKFDYPNSGRYNKTPTSKTPGAR